MDKILETIEEIVKFAVKEARKITDDSMAYEAKSLYAEWVSGVKYDSGQYANRNGQLYKCLTGHTSQNGWEPEAAPSLFAKVLPGQSGAETGEWEQPDSTNPYMKGDTVIHNGKTWESDIDNNVWEPGVYGWTETGIAV